MTREHKLALIVGFSLVLVLGVLISDHLSKSRNVEGNEDLRVADSKTVGAAPPGIVLASNSAPALQPLPGTPGFGSQQPPAPLPEMNPQPVQLNKPVEFEMVNNPSQFGQNEVSPQLARVTQMIPTGGIDPNTPLLNQPNLPGVQPQGVTTPGTIPQQVVVSPAPIVETKPTLPVTTGQMKRHDIREGDSIYSLAKQTYGDGRLWEKLRDFNKGKIGPNGAVREGVTIMLPPKDVLQGKAMMPDAKTASTPGPTPLGTPTQAQPKNDGRNDVKPVRPEQRIAGAASGNGYTTYTVQKGDILEEVARKTLGSSKRWPEIVEANKSQISDPESIQVGMTLRIPAR